QEGVDGVTRRAHKTPVDLLRQMLRILVRWCPDRRFVCCADGNYAAHELAEGAAAHHGRQTFVSKFYPPANPFRPPPPAVGRRAAAAGGGKAAGPPARQEGEGAAQAGPGRP